MIAIVAALLIGALIYVLYRQRKAHKAEVVSLVGTVLTERDRKMAAFHVRRFSDAVEQNPDHARIEEMKSNLRYWQAVMAAEEMRP